jgi:hypothetical protein
MLKIAMIIYACPRAMHIYNLSFVYSLTYSQVFELTTDSFISFLLSIKQAHTIPVDVSRYMHPSSSSRLCGQFWSRLVLLEA